MVAFVVVWLYFKCLLATWGNSYWLLYSKSESCHCTINSLPLSSTQLLWCCNVFQLKAKTVC